MAGSGAMADFGRMPTSRKVLVFVVIGMLAGFLYYRLGYKSLKTSLDEVKAKHTANTATNKTLGDDIPEFNKLRAKKELLDRLIVEHQRELPTESEVPAFFETLEHKITEAGVEVLKWQKLPEEAVESFVKVSLDVELTGNFLQLKRFFSSLTEKKAVKPVPGETKTEEHERIVSVENLALTSPTIRNREIILSAKFTAVTYRQGDMPEAGPGTPGAATAPAPGGGPGAPALPSTGTPAPMPSAGTPQGARIRVEDSVNKIDQRTRDSVEKANGTGSDRLKGGL